MRLTKLSLVVVCLAALMVPLVYAITFIGATNFIATNGGITTFADNFTATSLTYPDGLNRFTNLRWNGNLRGNFGVDADTGVNVSVTAIGRDHVTYTVTTAVPGAVSSYIYYYRNVAGVKLRAPTEVTADGVAAPFTYAGGVANITTTGTPVVVVVSYLAGVEQTDLNMGLDMLIQFFPIVMLVIGLEARRVDLIKNRGFALALLIAAVGVLIWAIRAAGY